MQSTVARITDFVKYVRTYLSGDEKGEAQIFCDRLFQAFGHEGIKQAGGTLEFRVHKGKGTKFADLLWRPRLLLEMKKRGEKLQRHYRQAFEYWLHLVPNRPKYVALCNFDEFWIYDFDHQLDEPMDRVGLEELAQRYTALNFLFPEDRRPQFNNDRVAVTRKAADKVAQVFNQLVNRTKKPVPRDKAQRFILQCVVALFAEDIDLLPRGLFTELLHECNRGGSSYDLLGGLFRQMANPTPAEGSRFENVPYFNGGIFAVVEPVELKVLDVTLLAEAAEENWAMVQPPIFGTLFEGSMDQRERHAFGAHYTSEADIQKVVLPTIVRPWRERIAAAKNDADLLDLRKQLLSYRVLDPACGSGNFLYVAYRELKRIEMELLSHLGTKARAKVEHESMVSAAQFFGIDIKPFAVELAKVTLMLARKLALDERAALVEQQNIPFHEEEKALPLDNLDANIRCDDALFCDWPKADAIIGNPPYLDARRTTVIHGAAYSKRLRERYPDVPGRSDLCVHWFRRAHDELSAEGRAGLVGTNTIRQNYAREGGLDYIVQHKGTITEAVSSQVWSGEAAVHVSIVNWIKGDAGGSKKLYTQLGDNVDAEWRVETVDRISSSLSSATDVSSAIPLSCCQSPKPCFEGQQPGHDGFRLTAEERAAILRDNPRCSAVILPYLGGQEFLTSAYLNQPRFLIDFAERDMLEAAAFQPAFDFIKGRVLTEWKANAEKERQRTGKQTGEHQNRFKRWWHLKRRREAMLAALEPLSRYIVCVRHTKRPVFEFISSSIRPDSALTVFAFADDYSFGILQSGIHWAWFTAKCSTLTERFRYTSDTVFDTFPWPQSPTLEQVQEVAAAAVALRALRRKTMAVNGWSLRDLYRTLETPGKNPLRDAHEQLDDAVRAAYGMKAKDDPLAFLLALNHAVAEREVAGEPGGEPVTAPGLPPCVTDARAFITDDCVRAPDL